MEVFDVVWDHRYQADSSKSGSIVFPLHEELRTKLARHHHWEIAVKSLIFCYPKAAFSALRKITPIVTVHFNHLDPISLNDSHSQAVLHRFPLPTFPIEIQADRMFSYEWSPDNLFFLKAAPMPSPPLYVKFDFVYGGGMGTPVDMKNILFSARLVYRRVDQWKSIKTTVCKLYILCFSKCLEYCAYVWKSWSSRCFELQ